MSNAGGPGNPFSKWFNGKGRRELPSSTPQVVDGLDVWFQRIFNEIRQIQAASSVTDGFLFFKTHRYTREELFEYPSFAKIESFVGQIESVIEGWKAEGAISPDRLQFYYLKRHEVEMRIGDLRADITLRTPTFWENTRDALSSILSFILEKLPLIEHLLTFFNIDVSRYLPGWAADSQKRIEDQRREDKIRSAWDNA